MNAFYPWLQSIAVILAVSVPPRAGVVFVENSRGGTNGELSSNNLLPTNLGVFTNGVNTVTGQVTAIGSGGANLTADIFTFQIPAGQALPTIVLSSFNTQAPSVAMFLALDNGPTFEYSAAEINDNINFPDLSRIMGAVVVGNNNIGTDILDDLRAAVNAGNGSAFATPLGPGAYTIYIQETGPFSNYSLNFNLVTAVPEPASVWLVASIGAGAAGIAWAQKRKRTL